MKTEVFAIYDSKADAYLQPFFTANKATAIRSFSDLVNQPNTQFSNHPGDYVLFHVASWQDDRGIFEPLTANINLGTGVEFQQPDDYAEAARLGELA